MARSPVPERRIVGVAGQDFFGGHIGSILDTGLGNCQAACLRTPGCVALTYNTRAAACFLKSGVDRVEPFAAAVSARLVETPQATRELAPVRAAELVFLPEGMLAEARRLAETLGGRIGAGDVPAAETLAAAAAAERSGDLQAAARSYAAAAAVSDRADAWRKLARLWLALADAPGADRGEVHEESERRRREAAPAALNAYLRSEADPARADTRSRPSPGRSRPGEWAAP